MKRNSKNCRIIVIQQIWKIVKKHYYKFQNQHLMLQYFFSKSFWKANMTEVRNRNRLLTVGSPITLKDVKENTNQLKRTNSCQQDKIPNRKGKSLVKISKSKDNNGNKIPLLKGKFESEIQVMSNQEICEQFQCDPIFKKKFEIWMKKVQSSKVTSTSSTSSNSAGDDQVIDDQQPNQITFKKSKSLNILQEVLLYERCQNLIVANLIPIN